MSIQSTISNPLWPEFSLTLRMHPLKLSRTKIERGADDSVFDEKKRHTIKDVFVNAVCTIASRVQLGTK